MGTEVDVKGRVVVGTDGSERAMKAVEWAADRARARSLPLLILYVAPEWPVPSRTAAAAAISHGSDYVTDFLASAQRKVDHAVEQVREQYPGLEVSGQVVQAHAPALLAELSADAELVVMGARGHSAPLSVKLLGGVTDAVTAHALGPIAVISDEAHENPDGPVVVGVDDSATASRPSSWPSTWQPPARYGVAIHAADFQAPSAYNAEIWDQSMDEINESMAAEVQSWLAEGHEKYPEVPVDVRVIRGRPDVALVDACRGDCRAGRGRLEDAVSRLGCCWAPPASTSCRVARTGDRHPRLSPVGARPALAMQSTEGPPRGGTSPNPPRAGRQQG